MDKLADILLVAGTIVVFWTFSAVTQVHNPETTPQPSAEHFSDNGSERNGGEPSAGWPEETLLWWEEASPQLSALSDAVDSGWRAAGDNDEEALNDARSRLEQAARFFAEADTPAALSPLTVQVQYAGTLCMFAMDYAGDIVREHGEARPFTVGQLATMRNDCVAAVHAARIEAARLAAASGDLLPEN